MSINTILGYFIPDEWILRFIIIFILITAAIVIKKCLTIYRKTQENLAMLESLSDVSFLENVLKNSKTMDVNQSFINFETVNKKNVATTEIFACLRTIYDAGSKSSRLDVDLLIKNTIDKIFAGTDFIKTGISLFLVMGIFGTLMGLAISIGSFSGGSFNIAPQVANVAATNELSHLFANLKGAFAPSMWGVLSTIFTVLGYTYFIQERCVNKLTDKLTVTIIKNWVPKLYPSDFQNSRNSLHELKSTIENAEDINDGVINLKENLKETNKTLKSISTITNKLTTTADKFQNATENMAAFQGNIDQVYQQVLANGEKLQSYVETAVNGINDFQSKSTQNFVEQAGAINRNFAQQNGQLLSIIQELQTHNANYVASQTELRENLKTSASKSAAAATDLKNATEGLVNRGDNTVKAVAEPIKAQLSKMTEDLNAHLGKISVELTRVSNPLESSADSIQKMFENVTKEIEGRTKIMEDSFNKQSALLESSTEKMIAEIDKRTKAMQQATPGGTPSPVMYDTGSKEIGEKLDNIETVLINQKDIQPVEEEKGIMDIINHWIPIVLVVLLIVSIGVQVIMVSRIGDLQKSQSAVTDLLLKGEKKAQ